MFVSWTIHMNFLDWFKLINAKKVVKLRKLISRMPHEN